MLEKLKIVFDIFSFGASIVEVIENPDDPWAWAGLALDFVDLIIPCVGGLGEAVDAVNCVKKTAETIDDVHDTYKSVDNATDIVNDVHGAYKQFDISTPTSKKGWHVGDDITNLTNAGNAPSWTTLRQRYWKNEAYYNPDLYPNDLARLKRGLAPIGMDGFPIELHHPFGRQGYNFYIFEAMERTEHWRIHYGP